MQRKLLKGLMCIFCCVCLVGTVYAQTKGEGEERKEPEIAVITDKMIYDVGESIVATLKNNSACPIYFIQACDVTLCMHYADAWMCEPVDCAGGVVTLGPDEQRQLTQEGYIASGKYKYRWRFYDDEAVSLSETAIYSKEFRID